MFPLRTRWTEILRALIIRHLGLAPPAALNLRPFSARLSHSMSTPTSTPNFFARFALAFRVLGNPSLAAKLVALEAPAPVEKPTEPPPEKLHAAGLAVLGLLQRE